MCIIIVLLLVIAVKRGYEMARVSGKRQPSTGREQELLALFRIMTEPDRKLLLFAAKKLISAKVRNSDRQKGCAY